MKLIDGKVHTQEEDERDSMTPTFARLSLHADRLRKLARAEGKLTKEEATIRVSEAAFRFVDAMEGNSNEARSRHAHLQMFEAWVVMADTMGWEPAEAMVRLIQAKRMKVEYKAKEPVHLGDL